MRRFGTLRFDAAAPAIAGVWTGDAGESWYRINGDHNVTYQLMNNADDGDDGVEGSISGTEVVKGENRYDTMFDAINYAVGMGEWAPGDVTDIVVASGESQADSLVAAGLPGALYNNDNDMTEQVPVILTEGSKLSLLAKRAIKAYADALADAGERTTLKIHIVGGEAAVSEKFADALNEEFPPAGD